jgi:uncharacterized membrane-anchored protein
MNRLLWMTCALLGALLVVPSLAGEPAPATPGETAAEQAYYKALDALHWVAGPTTVSIPGKSQLVVPQDYVFLDSANTDKYLELNRNLASGSEVLVAPSNMHWVAYLSFADEGYVKDNDKIDAAELLKALQEGTEQSNEERRKRGWPELHLIDWAVPPAYNASNKRLEWATVLEAEGNRNVNFSTKVLGRRGHTSVILVTGVDELGPARPELESVLAGYSFKSGETYADWVPGDKVAEYGLAALVLGGAAAIATKKGFWAVLGGFLAGGWKLLAAGGVAAAAGLRRFFGKKSRDDAN